MVGKIFISYRRNDGAANARSIRDRLAHAFGVANVFMDVDSLMAGKRFDKELEKALAETTVFLAVIGPRWMELLAEREAAGERDYVREEIAAALARDGLVVPILVDRGTLPKQSELPEELRALTLYQTHEVSHEHFGRDIDALISGIKAEVTPAPARKSVSMLLMFSGLIVACLAGGLAWYYLGSEVSGTAASADSGKGRVEKVEANTARTKDEGSSERLRELETAIREQQARDIVRLRVEAEERERARLQAEADERARVRAEAERERRRAEVERERVRADEARLHAEAERVRADEARRHAEAERARRAEAEAAAAQVALNLPRHQAPAQNLPTACGWYAIAYCSQDYVAARDRTPSFGSSVINTNDYPKFSPGWFCVVEGPLPRDVAIATVQRMKSAGASTAYFKNSC